MKTKQALFAVALSSVALSVFAGGFPGNPERDATDESLGTTMVTAAAASDGWKDVNVEHVAYVGTRGDSKAGGGRIYSKSDILSARMDFRDAPN